MTYSRTASPFTRAALCALACVALGGLAGVARGQRPGLRRGDKGDSVRILQHLLNDSRRRSGLAEISMDGDFGPATQSALRVFQRAASRSQTGVVAQGEWSALLRVASRGPLGSIDPLGPVSADRYKIKNKGPLEVSIHSLPEQQIRSGKRARPLLFESKFAVDADGDGNAWRRDPWGQPQTSLAWPNGRYLNPEVTPYFVLPIGFEAKHAGVKIGDIAAVIYKDKVSFALYGDRGPRTKIGEGSIKLAQELGINADPRRGGVSAGVFWIVFPGSGDRRALDNATIRARGEALFKAAGGKLPTPKRGAAGRLRALGG